MEIIMIKTTLETDRLFLKLLDGSHSNMVSDFLCKNKDFFAPYETQKNPFFYTPMYQKNILDREYQASINKEYLRYYVFLKEDEQHIIGTISFGNIISFPYCSCNIGYRFDQSHTGFGYAREACIAAISYAFSYLRIHRISAFILEENLPSLHLIEALGFHYEGICEKNIIVNGGWKSHRQYALINPFD